MTDEPRLLPPDPTVSGHHIIGQESSWKGTRLVNAEWDAKGGFWRTMGFRYASIHLAINGWVYVEHGSPPGWSPLEPRHSRPSLLSADRGSFG